MLCTSGVSTVRGPKYGCVLWFIILLAMQYTVAHTPCCKDPPKKRVAPPPYHSERNLGLQVDGRRCGLRFMLVATTVAVAQLDFTAILSLVGGVAQAV